MIKRALFAAALSLFASSPTLAASILYGVDNVSTYKVDATTGAISLIGSNGLGGFDVDGNGSILRDLTASSTTLYGAQWNVSASGITGAVATVDSMTGAVTASVALTGLVETGFNRGIYSLAYDLGTNTLFGNTSRRLYTIDPATGAATVVGNVDPSNRIIGLGIDGSTGALYSLTQVSDDAGIVTTFMNTLSKTDASVLSTVTLVNRCACDIAFDPLTGKGYISSVFYDAAGEPIYGGLDLLNSTATGTTFIGQHGINTSLPGLAFLGSSAPVPESSTWAMMIAGFGLAGCAIRRSKRLPATA